VHVVNWTSAGWGAGQAKTNGGKETPQAKTNGGKETPRGKSAWLVRRMAVLMHLASALRGAQANSNIRPVVR